MTPRKPCSPAPGPLEDYAQQFDELFGQRAQPNDLILDVKGETVFRPRPFYYALEGITRERIKQGLIADSIPEHLIATRTCIAVADTSVE
ncbi:MAG: hypothetical protein HYZ72_15040 [Deltaproteobacteria bacterium]|nr:hypothetical protein [Deltaproteobacteria bacterium]